METLFATFNRFEILISKNDVEAICQSGDNLDAVRNCLEQPEIIEQLNKIEPKQIALELREYGAWNDDELTNEQDNKERILWIGAWNIFEELE